MTLDSNVPNLTLNIRSIRFEHHFLMKHLHTIKMHCHYSSSTSHATSHPTHSYIIVQINKGPHCFHCLLPPLIPSLSLSSYSLFTLSPSPPTPSFHFLSLLPLSVLTTPRLDRCLVNGNVQHSAQVLMAELPQHQLLQNRQLLLLRLALIEECL